MQRRRVLLIALVVAWLAIPLATTSIEPTTYDVTLNEPIVTAPDIAPMEQAILSDTDDYDYWWIDFDGIGDVIDCWNMRDPDEEYGILIEEDSDPGALTNFKFERLFEFQSLAFQYLDWKLEIRGCDYTGIEGYWHENLKFYCSGSSLGPWTEVGVLDAETPTSYSWDMEVTTGPWFYIKTVSLGQVNDWGSRNEWRLEYLRIKCIDMKSFSTEVNVDIRYDDDNLYPYKGSGTRDYHRFFCSASNEEGSELIDYIRLYTKSETGDHLWGVIWNDGSWTLAPWSTGINLLVPECYVTSTSQVKTAVFAVQFTYECDAVSNIDFELYHESDTWSQTRYFDTTSSGHDLDQEPVLQFSETPTIAARSNPLSSPFVTGALKFAASGSGVAPHPSHAFAHCVRTVPTPSGEWSGGSYIDSVGNFEIPSFTKGVAGTENRFRVRVYESDALNQYLGLESYVETVSEEVVAYEYGANESSIPIDTSTIIFTKLKYFSDDFVITNATVSWNGVTLTFNPNSQRWEATLDSESEPTTIQFDSLLITTPEGISAVKGSPSFSVHWIRLGSFLHLSALQTYVPVSTVYDAHSFTVNIWLTDQNSELFAGWINLSIGGDEYDIYFDGTNYTTFHYYPKIAGIYTLFASYSGDHIHTSCNQTFTGLGATPRDMDYDYVIPSDMLTMVSTAYSFLNVYDNDYSGIFQGVTYIRDLPINISVSIWWTLSPDYGEPRNFVGTWNITNGEGITSWALPWDLDGDEILTDDDFQCYVIILLDGLDVFEDATLYRSVRVKQDLVIDVLVPEITYSDSSTFDIEIESLHDSSYSDDLGTSIELYLSTDNETWTPIDDVYTDSHGRGTITWICDQCGSLFFKLQSNSLRFAPSAVYLSCEANREGTRLTVIQVNSFTYSDQGVMMILLQTDDNSPLPNYPVYLEILDDAWVNVGTGLTNESGYVNILWTPTLPYGTYSVRVRAPMTESPFYNNPEDSVSILQVNKELLIINIDDTSVSDGYVGAQVTDDEGNPVEGIPVTFYIAGNSEPIGIAATDSEGYSRISATLYGAQVLRAVVQENDYYTGAFGEMNVALPPDILVLSMVIGSAFAGTLVISLIRKKRRGDIESTPKPVPPEVRKELEKEHELIPERRREETERKIAELDGGFEDADGS